MQSKWKIMTAMLKLVRPLWAWMGPRCPAGGRRLLLLDPDHGAGHLRADLAAGTERAGRADIAVRALGAVWHRRRAAALWRAGLQPLYRFKLLALIRDHVFTALRRLCPAKLEGRGKGDLISMLTSDVELLEVFYAHTISPVLIALIMSVAMSVLIGMWHPLLGVLALFSYALVGIVVPMRISSRCADLGMQSRTQAGASAASCWSRCAVWMKRSSMATVKHAQHS